MLMAGAVAAAYFTIAAVVVPKIHLSNASNRFTMLFRGGAVSFFVGCGLSHLHMAVHAITEEGYAKGHELIFHSMQVVGGWLFIWAAVRFLEINVIKRDDPKLAKLETLALRDSVTDAYNRRYFDETLEQELARSERAGDPLSVVIVDVDDFKKINDGHGHAVGDRVLKNLVELLKRTTRPSDTYARFGGDEFAILMPETEKLGALAAAERLRASVRTHDFFSDRKVSVSMGVASFPEDGVTSRAVVAAADRAMYWAKRHGKDMSAVAHVDPEDASPAESGDSFTAPLEP